MSGQNQESVAGIMLAAGLSSRMGRPKLGLPAAGRPLIQWAVDHCLQGGLTELILVVGPDDDPRPLLPASPRLKLAVNPRPQAGQSGSLKIGLAALAPVTQWAAVYLADMPCVWPEITRSLLKLLKTTTKSIIRPRFDSKPGHPVIFHRRWFDRLSALTGDQGGRTVVAAHPDQVEMVRFDATEPLLDVDTEADLARAEIVLKARTDGPTR
jgi:molybdenum cofactor cytidylyltransferase